MTAVKPCRAEAARDDGRWTWHCKVCDGRGSSPTLGEARRAVRHHENHFTRSIRESKGRVLPLACRIGAGLYALMAVGCVVTWHFGTACLLALLALLLWVVAR